MSQNNNGGSGGMTAGAEWRQGWAVVLSASLGFSLFSVMLAAGGIFMEPLGKEFGWNKATLSKGAAIATIVTALLSPFFGILIDKYGSRRLALPGIVLTSLGMASFSLLTGNETQWVALWVMFGCILVTVKSTVWSAAVANMFEKSRGLALGVTIAGTAVASAIVPLVGNWLIENFGWRQAYLWLAIGWGSVTFVLCFFLFRDSAAYKMKPLAARVSTGAAAPVPLAGLSIAQAVRSLPLWMILISSFVVMAVTQGFAFHLFPILTESGISRGKAAELLVLSGLAAIVGKLVTGWLLDRYRPNWIGGLTLAACALAFAPLIGGKPSMAMVVFTMLINGYAIGTKTNITLHFAAEYGGMRNFGKIYGTFSAVVSLAAGAGPYIAGRMYDASGSYDSFLMLGVAGCVLGGAMLIVLPRAPRWQHKQAAVEEASA